MDLTDVIGKFGKFQTRIFLVLLLRPICWTFINRNFQFVNQKVQFDCKSPGDENETADWGQLSGSCQRSSFVGERSPSGRLLGLNETVDCDSFVYEANQTYSTITQEWDLVCSREWMISFGYMIFSIGNFVAYMPAGQLADKFGRKPVIIVGQAVLTVASLIIAFSNSMTMFLVFRFVLGCCYGAVQNPIMASYVESVGPKQRDTVIYMFTTFWGVAYAIIALVAWLITEWQTLLLVSSLPLQLPFLLLLYWFVPESTRWLLSTKRYDRAQKQIQQQAKINGKVIEDIDKVMDKLKEKINLDTKADKASFLDIVRNRHLLKVTIILYISFVLTVFITHGFMLTITLDGGSIHLKLFLAGLADLPVALLYYAMVKYFTRRKGLLVSFVITAILFFSVLPISDDLYWLKLTLTMLGRMTNSLAYTLLYVFASELFPTNVRAVGVSGAMCAGRIGSILAPFADVLGRFHGAYLPPILYGVLSLLTSAIFLLLPETQNQNLPDTIMDFEILATHRNLTSIPEEELEQIDHKNNE